MLTDAGFVDIKITLKKQAREIIQDWMPGQGAEDYVNRVHNCLSTSNHRGYLFMQIHILLLPCSS